MFMDTGLSADGTLACASCHDPATAFGPNARTPNPFADADPAHAGTRAIPSLRYAQYTPRFTEHYIDDEEGHGVDGGPTGGFTWDGRADTAGEQARIPLFAAHEMGNADAASLARRVAAAPYANEFRRAFSAPGRDVFDDPRRVVDWVVLAFEVFEQGREFAPFDSRYDRWLAGRAALTPAEARGLKLYRDETKGNCDTCHPSRRSSPGRAPLFTDGGLVAVGAPRRAGLPPLAASSAQPLASEARGTAASTWACADPVAPGSPRIRPTAAAFARPRCATWPRARASSTTARCTRCARRWRSTRRATPIPGTGIRGTPTAACTSTTTCPRTWRSSSTARCRSRRWPAASPGSTMPRSTTSSRSCGR